jgi:hypothetical protein
MYCCLALETCPKTGELGPTRLIQSRYLMLEQCISMAGTRRELPDFLPHYLAENPWTEGRLLGLYILASS